MNPGGSFKCLPLTIWFGLSSLKGVPPERFLRADGQKNIGFPVSLSHIFFFPAALLPLRPGPCYSRRSRIFWARPRSFPLTWVGAQDSPSSCVISNVIRNITASPKGRTVEQREAASAHPGEDA